MATKEVISQEIIFYESVGRISKLLDQFCSGLHAVGLLDFMKKFPHLFVHLFTYTACACSSTVLECIYVDEETPIDYEDDVIVIMDHLKKFISDASEEGSLIL